MSKQSIQEWIQELLEKEQVAPPKKEVPADATCMDTHKLALQVETSIQVFQSDETTVHRLQDELSLDTSTLASLKPHVETLLSVFESFHLPGYKEATHVQTTLSLLQTLLNNYDSVMAALIHAKDVLANMDSRHIIHSSRLNEWGTDTIESLHEIKTQLLKHHDSITHYMASNSLLQTRLTKMERDRVGNQQLVLSLLQKLTRAEETVLAKEQEIQKYVRVIRQLKTEIGILKKFKEDYDGVGVIRELRKRTGSTGVSRGRSSSATRGSRQRALEYDEQQRVKQKAPKVIYTSSHSRASSASKPDSKPRSKSRSRKKCAPISDSDTEDLDSLYDSTQRSDLELIADLVKAEKLHSLASRYQKLKSQFQDRDPPSSRSRSNSELRLNEATARNTKKNSKRYDEISNPATAILLKKLQKMDDTLAQNRI
jgi:hypothetical protein